MAYTFLVFDFGGDEEVAQQARHKVDAWRQGFRLDKKMQLKFERKETVAKQEAAPQPAAKSAKEDSKVRSKSKKNSNSAAGVGDEASSSPDSAPEIRLIVRLDFSDHEKLSRQRWLDRIPREEPFKTAKARIVMPGDLEFEKTSEHFEFLD